MLTKHPSEAIMLYMNVHVYKKKKNVFFKSFLSLRLSKNFMFINFGTFKLLLFKVFVTEKFSKFNFTSVVVPYCYLFLLSVFILWFSYFVSDIFCKF